MELKIIFIRVEDALCAVGESLLEIRAAVRALFLFIFFIFRSYRFGYYRLRVCLLLGMFCGLSLLFGGRTEDWLRRIAFGFR